METLKTNVKQVIHNFMVVQLDFWTLEIMVNYVMSYFVQEIFVM